MEHLFVFLSLNYNTSFRIMNRKPAQGCQLKSFPHAQLPAQLFILNSQLKKQVLFSRHIFPQMLIRFRRNFSAPGCPFNKAFLYQKRFIYFF